MRETTSHKARDLKIAVVIPCYRVKQHVLGVIAATGPEVSRIYAVDDCCPEQSGRFVADNCSDPRVKVLFNAVNLGVGGAVMRGYQEAIDEGAQIIVKIDGDGQMDPALLPDFVDPIRQGLADYTKGNRFYDPEQLLAMPRLRLIGNAGLSLIAKLSTGYWQLFDPTNGYTAIHADIARLLPLAKISNRYFFETDMLFRLNVQRAVVADVPMHARYGDEVSSLKIGKILPEFLFKHIRNTFKRLIYNHYLRDVSLASVELPFGILLFLFGLIYGLVKWYDYGMQGINTPAGTVIAAVLPLTFGLQFMLNFLSQDIASYPRQPLHEKLYVKRAFLPDEVADQPNRQRETS